MTSKQFASYTLLVATMLFASRFWLECKALGDYHESRETIGGVVHFDSGDHFCEYNAYLASEAYLASDAAQADGDRRGNAATLTALAADDPAAPAGILTP